MQKIVLFISILLSGINAFSQSDSVLKIIFVPHPRSEDMVNQSVNPGIEKIDFSKYGMIMLGGDLTYSVTSSTTAMDYVDSLFDIGSPNTLWGIGNHDVESGNRAFIKQYTGRDSYYAYNRDNLTFMVLDCELNASGFSNTYILNDQLQMVKNVCDTISKSRYLILLHSRYIWMINNSYFDSKLDSIAASSKSMDTTNFYADIYPLLQKVKAKGIQVMVFGGDKSLINVKYAPEDSITFFAARLYNPYPDSLNNVIVLSYNLQSETMTSEYITLADIDKNAPSDSTVISVVNHQGQQNIKVWQVPNSNQVSFQLQEGNNNETLIQIYSINGVYLQSVRLKMNETKNVNLGNTGLYILKANCGGLNMVKKFVFRSNY